MPMSFFRFRFFRFTILDSNRWQDLLRQLEYFLQTTIINNTDTPYTYDKEENEDSERPLCFFPVLLFNANSIKPRLPTFITILVVRTFSRCSFISFCLLLGLQYFVFCTLTLCSR